MADLSDGTNWSEVDASNNNASPNGWPEGMMPSGVNDSARSDKGALKRFWDRINPVSAIGSSGGVWTFTTSNPSYPTSYVQGEIYTFLAGSGSGVGEQFRVNALPAKPIYVIRNYALDIIRGNDIVAPYRAMLAYDTSLASGAGGFLLLNPQLPIWADGTGGLSTWGGLAVNGSLSCSNITCSTITSNGNIEATGNVVAGASLVGTGGTLVLRNQAVIQTAVVNSSSWTTVADNTGIASLWLGTNLNYYRQTTHALQSRAGANYLVVDGTGATLNGALTVNGDITANSNNIHTVNLYASANVVAADTLYSTSGKLVLAGGMIVFAAAPNTSSWTTIYDNTGNGALLLGTTGNLYRQTTHYFQSRTGGTYATLDASGLSCGTLSSTNITCSTVTSTGNVTATGSLSGASLTVTGHISVGSDGIFYSSYEGSFIGFGYDGSHLVLHVDGTNHGNVVTSSSGNVSLSGTLTVGAVNVGAVNASDMIMVGDNYVASSFRIGTFGSYLGRDSGNGSTRLQTGQSYLLLNPVGGNVGIGTQTPGYNLDVVGTGRFTTDITCQNITANVQGYKPAGGSWASISDVRTKDADSIADYRSGLAEVCKLRPVSYRYNGRAGMPTGRAFVGLVADDVLPVMPEMIGTLTERLDPGDSEPTEILTLDATALLYALTNAVREMAAEIDTLKRTSHAAD